MEDLLRLATTYGFPSVVAIYLLVRLEPLIRSLKTSIDTLILVMALQNGVKARDFDGLKSQLEEQLISSSDAAQGSR